MYIRERYAYSLGFFFGPKGQACPQCGQMVCEECRILKPIEGDADIQFYRSSEWMCELCFKQKLFTLYIHSLL